MELGLYTDSLPEHSFEEALDVAARVGATAIEIATGGQSRAPHLRLDDLLADAGRRTAFRDAFASRGLRIAALNCSAWPLHPRVGDRHVAIIRSTIRLAAELGVTKIVTMSGNPGDGPTGTAVNFVWYPWPEDSMALLERQWDEAIALWRQLGAEAEAAGIEALAFELHPLHLVYNVPTYERMRDAVGPIIAVNLDPSHLFWQGMDPLAVVRETVARVPARLARADDEQLIETPFGGMRLRAYLPSRTFELTVHSLDLAAAIGQTVEPPPQPLAESLELAAQIALRRGGGAEVLLALTGRRPLPPDFSIVL